MFFAYILTDFNGANRMRWEQPGQGTSFVFNPKMADVL
jgi:hypothetical protein